MTAAFVLAATGTATAAPASSGGCSTTGATGTFTATPTGNSYAPFKVTLYVRDSLADGHHVRIRFRSSKVTGGSHTWQWRAHYDGAGTSSTWNTTAHDAVNGIRAVGAEIARFEGSTLLNSCVATG
ncbi:hypothetical protein ABZ853_27235 [Streptomyces albidoflavus]